MCVLENDIVKGIVTRNSFYSKLGWQYGYSLYASKEVASIMSEDFLSVDYMTPIDIVIKKAMARPKDEIYDYITVTKNGKYYGIATVKNIIEKTIEIEVDNARHSNPLTGLPGNVLIEQSIEDCIFSRSNYSVLYFDIDNFKAYNDIYGFERGDKVIKSLALNINENTPSGSFVGHIGGDDFIAILNSWEVAEICKKIIIDFNEFVQTCYEKKDLENGYITAQNRHGIVERFPLLSVSIAVLTNKNKDFVSVYALAKESMRLKKICKQSVGSSYIII